MGNVSKYGVFSGPYYPAFGLNTERYEVSLRIQSEVSLRIQSEVSLRIQSEYGKMRTKKTSYLDTFHAVIIKKYMDI